MRQIRSRYRLSATYRKFIIEFVHFVLHCCQSRYRKFLESIDSALRKAILLDAAESLRMEERHFESMRVYGLLLTYFPDSVLQYG
ncbi:hypothetical protein K493DRAFT_333400, partial [Basidiobolus meristosporus CBS 931.73]